MLDIGLSVRMAIASAVLLGVYLVIGIVLFSIGGIWAAALGLPALIAAQYFVTVQLPLWRNETSQITAEDHPRLYERAENLAEEMSINMPDVYLIEMGGMNAFAHGRRGKGKVFLSKKLVQSLSLNDLEPIIAHEFAHLKNRDSVLMGLSSNIVTIVSSVIFLVFLLAAKDSKRPWLTAFAGWVVSVGVQFLLLIFVRIMSRYREYVADEVAVKSSGRYTEMQNALRAIDQELKSGNGADMSATRSAISFMGFSRGVMGALLATHPATEKRISRIQSLKSEIEESDEIEHPHQGASKSEELDSVQTESISDRELIECLQNIDEYEFEHLVADLWSDMGWRMSVTSKAADRGIDVIAERDTPFHEKQIIQAKRYSSDNTVGSSEVQQYAGLHAQEDDVDAVVIVTTGRFTSDARGVAADSNVKLIDSNGLCKLIHNSDADFQLARYLSKL